MKRILAYITVACLAMGLCSCGANQPNQASVHSNDAGISTKDTPTISQTAPSKRAMYAITLSPVKETVTADDNTTLFTLSYQEPQIILENEMLENKIAGDLRARNNAILSNAAEIETQAHQDYQDSDFWSEYFIDIAYTPTRLDASVLSLFGNSFTYCGGPHPSLATDSVTYDLETGDVMYLDDVLEAKCNTNTLYQLVLDALADQAEDLYYDYADALGDRFTGELHSIYDWYFSRNGLCFHFAPYDIAPYSSGTIIAELPYRNLEGILKEKYLPTETPLATGSMYAESYTQDAQKHFSHIATVALCAEGVDILLYPDAAVTDLRIESGWRSADKGQYISGATVFAANSMDVGDAICLTTDPGAEDVVLRLIYHADGKEYSAFITYDENGSVLLSNN